MARKERKERKVETGLRWGEGFVTVRHGARGTRYVARWEDRDGLRRIERGKTFSTLDEAEDHLREVMRAKRDGRYQPESKMTVAELLEIFFEEKSWEWAPNTMLTAKVYRDRAVLPYLGSKLVVTLDAGVLQAWLNTLAKSGRRSKSGKITGGMSRSGVASARTIMNGALMLAVQRRIIQANPLRETRTRGASATPERPTWTNEEAATVLRAVRDDPWRYAFYALALTTGMRPGELRALHWRDVDLQHGKVTVRPSITRGPRGEEIIGQTTKTKQSRVVVIGTETIRALRAHRADQVKRRLAHSAWHDDDVVFDRGDGRFIPQANFQEMHRSVTEAAGVPHIRIHDMRHTHATLQADDEISPRVVMDTLGHKSEKMTMHYTHSTNKARRRAAERIAEQLFTRDSDTTTSPEEEEKSG